MQTVLTIGGVALTGAAASYLLTELQQKHAKMALDVTVSLGLIGTVGYIMMETARRIIHMFGGLPL